MREDEDVSTTNVVYGPAMIWHPRGDWTELGTIDGSLFQFGGDSRGDELAFPGGQMRSIEVSFTADVSHWMAVLSGGLNRRHRIRCRLCSPAGNPAPLPGGREYHRRQQARKRRANR